MTIKFNDADNYITKALVALLLLFTATGCKPKIHKLNITITSTANYYKNSDHIQINEYFVISNPPKNQSRLRQLLESEFKTAALPQNTICEFKRLYYKESSHIDRNYKETSPKHETIDRHSDDLIASIDWIKSPSGESLVYYYHSNGKIIAKDVIYNLSR